jgi:hypothetical protein
LVNEIYVLKIIGYTLNIRIPINVGAKNRKMVSVFRLPDQLAILNLLSI